MLKNLSHSPARRRKTGITIAVGVLVATGISVAAPAVAAMTAQPSVVDAEVSTTDAATAAEAVIAARATLTHAASTVIAAENSGFDLGDASTAVDTSGLLEAMDDLDEPDSLTALQLPIARMQTVAEIASVTAQTTALSERQDAAEQKAKEKAKQKAKEKKEAAEAAEAAAAALANVNTPDGARATAATIAADDYGWGSDQFSCLNSLWQKESGWNYQAYNADGGATGIPQALPGNKMAAAGADWATNAATQIRWGLDYIQSTYGSPCSAWGHSQAMNWY